MSTVTSFILPDLPMTALPSRIESLLRYLRELPSRKLHVRFYVHNVVSANFRIGPQGATGLVIAMFAQLYFNLVDKPWWLTNLLGFSFAYSALQFMSPTTS
jgi:minor histocompatibility antigen H13